MFETVFYFPWEVSLIIFLQSTLPGFVLGFFEVIAEVVSKNVLALLFILIYLAYNKDWGKFTLLSLGVAGVCCEFVKVTVARLRPYAAVDTIKCIRADVADQNPLDFKIQGYSFPSGHTMMATNLFLAIPIYVRNIQYISIGLVGVFIVALLVGVLFCPEISYIKYVALALGISLGFLVEEKYVNFENPKSRRDAIVRLVGAVILFVLLFVLIPKFAGNTDLVKCIVHSLCTFIMLAIYPLAFKKIDRDG